MQRRPKFRRPGHPSRWDRARDWLSSASAIGTILIGVGTLWVTARVSGLEEYFRSELSSRNSQLSSVLEDSAAAGRQLRENERQLAGLRAITDETIATALETQSQLSASTASLLAVQEEIELERANLIEARSQLESLAALAEEQRSSLTLLFAREVHDRAAFSIGTVVFAQDVDFSEPRAEIRVPLGRLAFTEFERLALEWVNDPQVGEVYQRLVARLPRVCPGFKDWEVIAAAIPDRPALRLDEGTTPIEERYLIVQEGIRSYTDDVLAFMTYGQGCVCDALVVDPKDRATVCGASSGEPR